MHVVKGLINLLLFYVFRLHMFVDFIRCEGKCLSFRYAKNCYFDIDKLIFSRYIMKNTIQIDYD